MTDDKDKNKKDEKKRKAELDAIESLPLDIIPLGSSTLKTARLIKNSRMETSVELYNDAVTGSLQVTPKSISEALSTSEQDQEIINQLAELHSFDVYSLRTSLKKLGLEVDDSVLELSPDMKETLEKYSMGFIRPMVEKIYGAGEVELEEGEDLGKLFRDPDVQKVRNNLRVMTERTGIPMEDIPKFLENYNDVYLSVAYYRYSFETVSADIERFFEWIKDVKTHRDVTSSAQTLSHCKKAEDIMRFLYASIRERLGKFHASFEMFWDNINEESFKQLRETVEENHSSMGAVLCGLVVKMRSWEKEFPNNEVAGPSTRAKFVVSEMEPGLDKLKDMENAARRNLGLKQFII